MTESYYRTDTGQSSKGECLSDIQMAALLDNSLKPIEKQVLMKHLNACNDCRFCWMEASISISNITPVEEKTSWRERMRQLVAIDFMPPKLTTSVAFISVAFFCALVLFPLQKGIEPLLDEQYASLTTQQHSLQAKQAMSNMPLPWEHATFSFAPTQKGTSATFAFAEGLIKGRNTLSNDTNEPLPELLLVQQSDERNVTEREFYYQLGRWIASLWFVSQLENNVDWSKQLIIMERFNNTFMNSNNRVDQQSVKTLKNLQRINAALEEIQQLPHTQDDFRQQMERVMIQLSPDSLRK